MASKITASLLAISLLSLSIWFYWQVGFINIIDFGTHCSGEPSEIFDLIVLRLCEERNHIAELFPSNLTLLAFAVFTFLFLVSNSRVIVSFWLLLVVLFPLVTWIIPYYQATGFSEMSEGQQRIVRLFITGTAIYWILSGAALVNKLRAIGGSQ